MVCNYEPSPKTGNHTPNVRQHTDPGPVDPTVPVSPRIRGRYPMLCDMGSPETCTPTLSPGSRRFDSSTASVDSPRQPSTTRQPRQYCQVDSLDSLDSGIDSIDSGTAFRTVKRCQTVKLDSFDSFDSNLLSSTASTLWTGIST